MTLNAFATEGTQRIVDTVRDYERRFQGRPAGGGPSNNDLLQIRMAKVVDIGSIADANVVKVELGLGEFDDEQTGKVELAFTAKDPQDTRYVMEFDGPAPRVGDKVLIVLHNRRWWIIKNTAPDWEEGRVASPGGINYGGTGKVDVYRNDAFVRTENVVALPWLTRLKVSYSKEVMIQWDRFRQLWCIRLAECE